MNNSEFQEKTGQIDRLVQRVNGFADDNARATSLELLQSMMDLHGAAMSRMVELLLESGEGGRSALAKLGSDPLICGLLVLYGIHPVDVEERVARAIEKLRPQLQKHGRSLELLDVSGDEVKVRIQSSGNGCSGSPDTLKTTIEQAVLEVAPEIALVRMEGVADASFVPVNLIQPVTKEEVSYEKSTA